MCTFQTTFHFTNWSPAGFTREVCTSEVTASLGGVLSSYILPHQASLVLVTALYDYLIYLTTFHDRSESPAIVSFLLTGINLRTEDDRLCNLLPTLELSLPQFSVHTQ